MFVRLEGIGGIVPIAVDNMMLDLRTCVLGQTYRDKIVIHNRGKVALKCSMKLKSSLVSPLHTGRREMSLGQWTTPTHVWLMVELTDVRCLVQVDYLLFNPELLYCQGGASSYFNVTFKPTAAMWDDLGKLVDRDTGVMEVRLTHQASAATAAEHRLASQACSASAVCCAGKHSARGWWEGILCCRF